MATSSKIPAQKNDVLLVLDALAPYNTLPASRLLRDALRMAVRLMGFDATKTALNTIIAAFPAVNPSIITPSVLPNVVPTLGVPVSVNLGTYDGVPQPAVTYQWKRDGSNIAGATAQVYTPVTADVGNTLSVVITGTNSGSTATETLAFTDDVADNAAYPHNTAVPTITGTTTAGQTLTGHDGTWTGTPAPTLTRQWYRDTTAIAGQTAATYLLVAGDATHTITYKVTGTNTKGTLTVASVATAAIAA